MYLVIEIRIGCNYRKAISEHKSSSSGCYIHVDHVVHDQWNSVIFAAHMQCMCLLCLSVSLLPNWKMDSMKSVCWQAGYCYHTSEQSYTSYKSDYPLLPVDHVQKGQTFLNCVPSSADRSQHIHPSSQNQKVSVTLSGGILYWGRIVEQVLDNLL